MHDYDIIAKIYDPFLYLFLQPIRITVMQRLSEYKDKKILDLCCGTGNQLKLLAKNGFQNLHCLDLSKAMLKIAENNDYTINIYNADATKTNFSDNIFDVIIISFAIHEKDKDTQIRLLNEAARLLKEDGLLLIVDYDFDKSTIALGRIGITIIERMAGKEHYNNFKNYMKNNSLSGLIDKNKFQIINQTKKIMQAITISSYKKIG
jgi:demethylmenaquinone methyltransferase/2-methoxy-6-polyprenyl-1,4-benzoquinol methylase